MVKAEMTFSVPEKPTLEGIESKWGTAWEEHGTYSFDTADDVRPIYSIDTPPPTVSGSLHAGHVLSYTHTDIIARFKRMSGHNVFYPMGFDDNGLPTERRVQNYYGITCDPSITYLPEYVPVQPKDQKAPFTPISRTNFIQACQKLTQEDEKAFEDLWKTLGLSVDWSKTYTTIDQKAQYVSQLSFLRLFSAGKLYHGESPTLWDVDFQSAVSQAELEDKEESGTFFAIYFTHQATGDTIEIQTTRPELLASCVALVAHPDDPRYQKLFGTTAVTPLFEIEVPILAHPLAEIDKGSGIAMVCTFGDLTDVTWWKELNLDLRPTIDKRGRMVEIDFKSKRFESLNATQAQEHYSAVQHKTVRQAKSIIAGLLSDNNFFADPPRPIQHSVKYYEKGDKPLEIVTSWQWYIKTMEHKDKLLELGNQLNWNPPYMKVRYENWIHGLTSDWNISRQRYFGIPIPVWYPIDENGNINRSSPILPQEKDLPIDPFQDVPNGYDAQQRGCPNGFIGDSDVMDTWATSSLTPQIACEWERDDALYSKLFPMNLRPQGHDIIRTWLFYTVLRSYLSDSKLPWKDTVISGFVLDPDRKKMSKSKGNVVTPMPLIDAHGADALRYWAANGRPGVDTALDENTMKKGRRLAIKIINASKFGISIAQGALPPTTSPQLTINSIDQALLSQLEMTVAQATKALNSYDYSRSLEIIETFFWSFCDNYIELEKLRGYGTQEFQDSQETFQYSDVVSARVTLLTAIETLMCLFAPYMPYATEEVWSWFKDNSVHLKDWPTTSSIEDAKSFWSSEITKSPASLDPVEYELDLELIYQILSNVRRAKTEAKVSMKAPVLELRVIASHESAIHIRQAKSDLLRATQTLRFELLEEQGLNQPKLEIQL